MHHSGVPLKVMELTRYWRITMRRARAGTVVLFALHGFAAFRGMRTPSVICISLASAALVIHVLALKRYRAYRSAWSAASNGNGGRRT